MGRLIYGPGDADIEFEDRLLAHLKVVIIAKLRRDESFIFNWDQGAENGGGRSSIWLHASIPLHFRFFGNKQPPLNRVWLEELMQSANSANGLHVLPEPPETGSTPAE